MTGFHAERLLARTFFRRLFESDLMPSGMPQIQLVIWGIAVLAGPGYLRSFLAAVEYERLMRFAPAAIPETIRADALFFITFGMLGLGFVALIVWEGVFPDRRDARALGVLPLRPGTLVVGRLAAVSAVACLFCLGVNLPPAVIHGISVSAYEPHAGPLRSTAAHLVATSLANLSMFFAVVGTQGLLLAFCGRHLARRLALALQVLLVIGLVQMFVLLPFLSAAVSRAFRGEGAPWVLLLPSAWFLALYEWMGGSVRMYPGTYPWIAATATTIVIGGTVVLLTAGHRRLVRLALESPESHAATGWTLLSPVWRLGETLAPRLLRHPVRRAVAGFTLRTVVRSRTHMMLVMTYLGIGAALALTTVLPLLAARGLAAAENPTVPWLSVPLILSFFGLCGMRMVMAVPVDVKANWAFRLQLRDDDLVEAVRGARMALLAGIVLPVTAAAALAATALWGLHAGAVIGLMTGALGMLLTDVLIIGLRKVPFTCTYLPGRSRARTLWPVYLIALSVYAFGGASVELAALTRPHLVVQIVVAAAVTCAGLAYLRWRDLQPPTEVRYEEQDPDGMFEGFGLSEGLAARGHTPLEGSPPTTRNESRRQPATR